MIAIPQMTVRTQSSMDSICDSVNQCISETPFQGGTLYRVGGRVGENARTLAAGIPRGRADQPNLHTIHRLKHGRAQHIGPRSVSDHPPFVQHRHIIRCQIGAARIFEEGPRLAG